MSASDELCVNTIRVVAAEMVQQANSGHPGAPMGLAPVAHTLWNKVMNFNAANPKWWNRDRFVLSNGHACALQYTSLHLAGYDVTRDDLISFRQLGSKCPGHPENFRTPGIEVTTGPLGQGIANGVGFAIAESHLASLYNKPGYELFNNHTYVVCGDGCLQEGVACEAISLAGTMKLNKLVLIYDDNKIQIDGSTDLAFTENIPQRFDAMGWNVITVENGNTDFDGIYKAITDAKASTDKPTIVIVKTIIGFASKKEGTEGVHGSPLGEADLANVKTKLGFNPEERFVVPAAVRERYDLLKQKGSDLESAWNAVYTKYKAEYTKEATELEARMSGVVPANLVDLVPKWEATAKADATRNTSGVVLNALAPALVSLMGGSADLTPSNKTWIKCSKNYSPEERDGRYLRFGVREHAMAAIGNGLSAYGGFIPFTATFLNFIEYALGAVRISALASHKQLYIMTHDSIGLGEDGPTHQPIEAVNLCRAMPNLLTLRPADANEVSGAYVAGLQFNGPSVLCLSRQDLPMLPNSSVENTLKGAYLVTSFKGQGKQEVTIIATGSEVEYAMDAAKLLAQDKEISEARVVSAPCLELFDAQSKEYRKQVLGAGIIVSVEAAAALGWSKYAHNSVAMTGFGESAPTPVLYKHFGFTGENIASVVKTTMQWYEGSVVPPVQATLVPAFAAASTH